MNEFLTWPFAFIVVGGLSATLGFLYKMFGGSIKDCPRNPSLTINIQNLEKNFEEFKKTSKENWGRIDSKLDKLILCYKGN